MQTLDETKVEAFAGQIVVEAGAAVNAALVNIGDRLGLYRAMADAQPVTAAELASRTATHERYVREWLNAQAAGSFVTYDPASDTYVLPAEHAFVLADETSPVAMAGIYSAVTAAIESREHVAERFRSGDGLGWHEHHHDLFHGTERAFGALYRMHLLGDWLPSLDGVVEQLERGASVADVGCGHGASAIMMAQAFPHSTFHGIDVHGPSIEIARARAAEAGVADRVTFEVADAASYTGRYDIVAFFDALHDLGDPVGAARHARAALAPGGTLIVVEPFAGDTIEGNLTPVGRYFYGISTLVCTPGSLSQPGRAALGTQAGEARLRDVLLEGGFATVRRAAATPFNLVLEARGQSIVS
jgi:2-polyprenyl-3-methyl-5-hydroxy-6-metoxy-1,4-benzoquinol methylase